MQPQQQQQDKPSMQGAFNVVQLIMKSHALAVGLPLRTNYGSEGIGIAGLGAIFMIIAWGSITGDGLMFLYLIGFIVCLLAQRMKSYQNWRKGDYFHSYYDGFPWLTAKLFPRMQKEGNLKAAEGFLVAALGGLLLNFGVVSVGAFLLAGIISIPYLESVKAELNKKRVRAMRDAQIEQQYLAEEFHRGDRSGF